MRVVARKIPGDHFFWWGLLGSGLTILGREIHVLNYYR